MPSLDFAIDAVENLKSQGISFLLVTAQENKKGEAVINQFYHFAKKENSVELLEELLKAVLAKVEKNKTKKKKQK